MYTIKKVNVITLLDYEQAELLFDLYAAESRSDTVPMHKPDRLMYTTLEDQGMLDCIVVYKDDAIVGFTVILTTKLPHYSALSTTVESIFVLKDHRPRGTGLKLLQFAQDLARERGSRMFFMSAPIDSKLNTTLSRSGMKAISTVYSKDIS